MGGGGDFRGDDVGRQPDRIGSALVAKRFGAKHRLPFVALPRVYVGGKTWLAGTPPGPPLTGPGAAASLAGLNVN